MSYRISRPYWKPVNSSELKVLRQKLSLTQIQFSKWYGVDLSSLRNWEQGRAEPTSVTDLYLRKIVLDSKAIDRLIVAAKKHADSA